MSEPVTNSVHARPPAIADYDLVRPIGRGAYGEVWLARNLTGTLVALKLVQRSAFDHQRPFEREFEGIQRFEPISRSDPSQVGILHVGRGDGFFYYVMDLADDMAADNGAAPPQLDPSLPLRTAAYEPKTLKRLLQEKGHLSSEDCIKIALSIARGLAHLHRNGLVHRDVKPSNVIFVNGVAKLADIGLVTTVDATRSFVGTEGYLPNEGAGSPQADLYSLGKVLYEMSTGCDRKQFPALPSDISTRPDRTALAELNAIVLRACQPEAGRRYQSAEEIQADLHRLQRGRSIRKHHVWQSRWRALRKTAVGATLAMVVLAGIVWQTRLRAPGPRFVNQDATAGTRNLKAAEAYDLGLSALRRGTGEGFSLARENFTTATQIDPTFVAAYARMFEVYLMSEDHGIAFIDGKREKLNELSATLTRIAPSNAESHAALAICRFVNEWKWREAELEFKRALEADHNCRMALAYYGYFLTCLRRIPEARDVLQRARALDPASPLITKFLGHCEFFKGGFESALPFYLKASDLEPSYPSGHYWAGRAYLARTNYSQALEEFKQFELRQGEYPPGEVESRYNAFRESWQKGGARGYWLEESRLTGADSRDTAYRHPYFYAECYAHLGEANRAFEALSKAFAQQDSMEHLLADEFWDAFRQRPEFQEIVKKLGLDSWAR